jgi:hypothetical protein
MLDDNEAGDNRYARYRRVLPDRTCRVAQHLTENVFIHFMILPICFASCRNRLPQYFKLGNEGRQMKREPATPAAARLATHRLRMFSDRLAGLCGCRDVGL